MVDLSEAGKGVDLTQQNLNRPSTFLMSPRDTRFGVQCDHTLIYYINVLFESYVFLSDLRGLPALCRKLSSTKNDPKVLILPCSFVQRHFKGIICTI